MPDAIGRSATGSTAQRTIQKPARKMRATVAGFTAWSVKDGVAHVQPPGEVLERMLGWEEIRTIVPGVTKAVRDARGEVKIRVTVATQNGWKAIALAAGSRQELFISTALEKIALEGIIEAALEKRKW